MVVIWFLVTETKMQNAHRKTSRAHNTPRQNAHDKSIAAAEATSAPTKLTLAKSSAWNTQNDQPQKSKTSPSSQSVEMSKPSST